MKPASTATGATLSRARLLGLFALALALRWGSAWFASVDSPFWLALNVDDRAYHDWALRIAQGQWSDGQAFFLSPLYPYVLGGLYYLSGESRWMAVVLQCVLSAATVPILASLGARLFGSRAGLLTGLLSALYGPLIFFSECLLSETLHLFLVCAGLLQLQRASGSGHLRGGMVAGCLLGLAAVARAYFLASGVLLGLWLFVSARRRSGARALPLGFALGFLLALAPSAIHNRRAGGDTVLVNASGGINFYLGNHVGANGRIHPPPGIPAESLMNPDQMRATFAARAQAQTGQTLGAADLSSHYYSKGGRWIVRHPGDWFALLGVKLRQVAEAFEYPGDRNVYQAQRWSPILRWTPVGWTLVLALALGACVMPAARRKGVGLVHIVNGVGLAVLLAFLVTDRFRLVLLPGCLVLAGLGADGILHASGQARRMGRAGRVLTLLSCAVSLSLGAGQAKESHISHLNLALQHVRRGQLVRAESSLRESIRLRPGFLRGHWNLARVLMRRGEPEEAEVEMGVARRLAREQGIPLGPGASQVGSGQSPSSPPER